MATKKVKKVKGSEDWEKDLEKEAEAESAREKAGGGGGHSVSIKGRRFTFGGENLGRELKCVVVDSVYINQLYDSKFKEDKATIPVCFALSGDGEEMAPHEESVKPQSDACEGCEHNEWGSGRGRAKACKQGRRLALIHEDDLEDVADAEIVMLNVPPTSAKGWGRHVKDVKAKLARPPYAVLTVLSFDMDADYPTLEFSAEEKLDKDVVEAIQARREEARELLMTPYDGSSYEESDDEDDEGDEDEDDEKPVKKAKKTKKAEKPVKKAKKAPPKKVVDEDDEDEDDDEDDEDEDDEKPVKKAKKAPPKKVVEEDDEDDEDEDEDDDEDDDEDEEDEKPVKKGGKSRFRR